MSEINLNELKVKKISHKERKMYFKKIIGFSNAKDKDELKVLDDLTAFREEFVCSHLIKPDGSNFSVEELNELESEQVDKLFNLVESKMDFRMGLNSLIRQNTRLS